MLFVLRRPCKYFLVLVFDVYTNLVVSLVNGWMVDQGQFSLES